MADQYKALAAMAPEGKLQLLVDFENRGDLHLTAIAEELDEDVLADTLCPRWGIKPVHVKDIKTKNRDNPQRMRMELLRKWINTAGVGATYENLVKDLLDIGESRAARAIAQLWNYKPASSTGSMPVKSVPQEPAPQLSVPLSSLMLIKWHEEGHQCEFRLVNRVSAKWKKFGLLLDLKHNVLDGWNKQFQADAGDCWVQVMQHWMDGGSKTYPATWQGLYSLVEDVGYPAVAKELKEAVEKS